jgi:hypothetical protein
VKHAAYLGDYRLVITFEDGAIKVVDLGAQLEGEIFEPLKVPSYFASFEVSGDTDTVVWPNGADFSPDWLYEVGTDAPKFSHTPRETRA